MSGDQRKAIQRILDARRDQTGIGSGKARVSVTDPEQLTSRDGTLLNIGEVNVGGKVRPADHRTYPTALPGEGLGKIEKDDVLITQLFPETVDKSGKVRRTVDPSNPQRPDLRSFEVRPIGGIIDDKMLKRIYGGLTGLGAGTILGTLAGGSDRAMASPIPGGFDMPDMSKVRENASSQQSAFDQDGTNLVLEMLLNFMAPTPIGGGIDTMTGYQRSQTR